MHMCMKTVFGSADPLGNRKWSGRPSEVWSSSPSIDLCRVQKPPFRSSSLSSGPGRCRCSKFRPKSADVSTTPPNDCSWPIPLVPNAWSREPVATGLLFSKASSLAGKLVRICALGKRNTTRVFSAPYISFIECHRPASSYAGISINVKSHPECASPFLSLCPILRGWETLLHV
jgi:hypothetical protein